MTELNIKHPSVVERYYTPHYKMEVKKNKDEDHCVLTHSNRLCVITLANSHPVIKEKKKVQEVNYRVDKATNRLDNKVTGKGKKGAQWLTENSPLCHITCEDGSTYTICTCIRGHLVEVNVNLTENPTLINEKPSSDGYIAIVLPKLNEHETVINNLLTHKDYVEKLKLRESGS